MSTPRPSFNLKVLYEILAMLYKNNDCLQYHMQKYAHTHGTLCKNTQNIVCFVSMPNLEVKEDTKRKIANRELIMLSYKFQPFDNFSIRCKEWVTTTEMISSEILKNCITKEDQLYPKPLLVWYDICVPSDTFGALYATYYSCLVQVYVASLKL